MGIFEISIIGILVYIFIGIGFTRISLCYTKAGSKERTLMIVLWLLLVSIAAIDKNFVERHRQIKK